MAEDRNAPRISNTVDARFLIVVGALMALIIASLAGLWVTERNRRIGAEKRLAEQARREPLEALMRGLGGSQLPVVGMPESPQSKTASGIAVGDILSVGQVQVEGKPHKLIRIDAAAGQRLGVRPGDVVLVEEPAATTLPKAGD